MTQKAINLKKLPLLEMLGILLVGLGLCFSITFVGVGCSEERLAKEKQQVAAKMEEMRSALAAAETPAEQVPALLRVHKAALVSASTHEHFILMSFFVLSSLWVASIGLTAILWAKLRAITKWEKTRMNSPIAEPGANGALPLTSHPRR